MVYNARRDFSHTVYLKTSLERLAGKLSRRCCRDGARRRPKGTVADRAHPGRQWSARFRRTMAFSTHCRFQRALEAISRSDHEKTGTSVDGPIRPGITSVPGRRLALMCPKHLDRAGKSRRGRRWRQPDERPRWVSSVCCRVDATITPVLGPVPARRRAKSAGGRGSNCSVGDSGPE